MPTTNLPTDDPQSSHRRWTSLMTSSSPPPSDSFFSTFTTDLLSASTYVAKSISTTITGKNTLPDKTTASQVLMFRQLLHTKCRPGLRLSRSYEATEAQRAVLHMPWWERGIEQSSRMVISYDNLITRLWLGAVPHDGDASWQLDERGLPPIPHRYWIDRLGFQQDDPVTDFRSGGVLSLAMLVHVVESCPAVYARFVKSGSYVGGSLEEILTEDACVLPFGITCINITDMLAKFLMFSKAVDKMDALLSSKPFWKMFIDPNAMLVLQEVSLDLLCDVCVEIGRERRLAQLTGESNGVDDTKLSHGPTHGKVTVFDFSEIMDRTEKRVGEEVLGAGPQTVDELRTIARKVKSRYLMRIQLKERHSGKSRDLPSISVTFPESMKNVLPGRESIKSVLPGRESMKNVTSVIGGMGGLVTMWTLGVSERENELGGGRDPEENGEVEIEYGMDRPAMEDHPDLFSQHVSEGGVGGKSEVVETFDLLGGESSAVTEAFDLLGDDFSPVSTAGMDQDLLDSMDVKLDPSAAFTIDDDDFMITQW